MHLTQFLLASNPSSGIIITGDFNQFRHSQLCNSFILNQVVKDATREDLELKLLGQSVNFRCTRMIGEMRPINRKLAYVALSSLNCSPLYRMFSCNDKFHYFTLIVSSIVER